jgi:hypothetical protein
MNKEMIISSGDHETRVAILEDDQVVEVFIEREKQRGVVGNVYKGRVNKILPACNRPSLTSASSACLPLRPKVVNTVGVRGAFRRRRGRAGRCSDTPPPETAMAMASEAPENGCSSGAARQQPR